MLLLVMDFTSGERLFHILMPWSNIDLHIFIAVLILLITILHIALFESFYIASISSAFHNHVSPLLILPLLLHITSHELKTPC